MTLKTLLPRWLAVHEAGHAATAMALARPGDRPVDWLQIGRDESGYHGQTKFLMDLSSPTPIEQGMLALAGPVAEYRYRRRSLLGSDGNYRFELTSDFQDAKRRAMENDDDFDLYMGETIEIVRRQWPVIMTLADRLLAGAEIQGDGFPFAFLWPS